MRLREGAWKPLGVPPLCAVVGVSACRQCYMLALVVSAGGWHWFLSRAMADNHNANARDGALQLLREYNKATACNMANEHMCPPQGTDMAESAAWAHFRSSEHATNSAVSAASLLAPHQQTTAARPYGNKRGGGCVGLGGACWPAASRARHSLLLVTAPCKKHLGWVWAAWEPPSKQVPP
jgi:hypothetical protein